MQMGVKRLIVVSTPQRTRKRARPVVICEDQASIHLQRTKEIIKISINKTSKSKIEVEAHTKWAEAPLRYRLVSWDSSYFSSG